MTVPTRINIRVSRPLRELLDRGAAASNKTLADFILEASVAAAQNVLLDQTHFALDTSQMVEFARIMTRPLSSNRVVSKLLATKSRK